MDPKISAKNALRNVLDAVPGERLIVICDEERLDVGKPFAEGALDLGLYARLFMLDKEEKPRKEIPRHLVELLTSQAPDIYINLLKGGADETPFRVKIISMENRRRVRLGHCPGITLDMLEKGALALTDEEHKKMQEEAQKVVQMVSGATEVHITNPAGTDFTFRLDDSRDWFTDTKINWKTMKWMNLPTGEVIVGPIEDSLNGKVVCDVAVGGYGPLDSPITIEAKNGQAVSVECKNEEALAQVKKALATDSWSDKIGEFAFGLNPKARLVKEFLETEKLCKTVHIAFGNNRDYPGGKNMSANHMDFLMSKPTVEIKKKSGEKVAVMKDGKFTF
jgi:leucyl aminopeptidase (aminopeptidase T)